MKPGPGEAVTSPLLQSAIWRSLFSAWMLACVVSLPALAAGERGWTSRDGKIAIGAPTIVAPDAAVEHDILEVGESVQVYGLVKGNVLALGGDVYVFGRIEGDAMALFGRVIVRGDGAIVAGNATAIGGNVWLQMGGSVLGQTRVSLPLDENVKPSYLGLSTRPEVLILRLVLVACWTLMALAAAFAAPTSLVRASLGLRRRPAGMLTIGALLHVSAILFTALIALFVGLPLLGLLLIVMTIIHAMGFATAFHFVGERVVERLSSQHASGHAKLLVGALVMASISFVPFVGEIAWVGTAFAGSGAILATRNRRHRRER